MRKKSAVLPLSLKPAPHIKVSVLAALLLFCAALCGGEENTVRIFFPHPLPEALQDFVRAHHRMDYTANILTVETAVDIDALLKLAQYYNLQITAHEENIKNAQTTRTPAGVENLRKIVHLDQNGLSSLKNQTDETPALVYDPSHPDAILSGPHAGYVVYPAISLQEEYAGLVQSIENYNVLAKAIKQLAGSAVIITEKELAVVEAAANRQQSMLFNTDD